VSSFRTHCIDFSCRSSAAYMLVAVAFLRLIFCEHPTCFVERVVSRPLHGGVVA